MRLRLAFSGIASVAVVLGACAPRSGAPATPGGIPERPVMLGQQPLCTFRVLARLEGRINHLGPQIRQGRDRHPVVTQARALGADAVIGYNSFPEFDNNRRQVATRWDAIAIDFSDPSDPNCYR